MRAQAKSGKSKITPNYNVFFGLLILTSSLIIPDSLDPYFLGKQIIGLVMAIYGLVFSSILIRNRLKGLSLSRYQKMTMCILISFPILIAISAINSKVNSTTVIFGSYQRSNGLATILTLVSVFLFVFLFYNQIFKITLLKWFSIFGKFHALLLICQHLGFDLLYFNTTYGPVIGLLGNPNFASALMGILVPFLCPKLLRRQFVLSEVSWLTLSLIAVVVSNSYQGYFGFIVVLLYMLISYSQISRSYVFKSVVGLSLIVAILAAIASLFRAGPLSDLVYKSSFGIRFEYYNSAFRMFLDHPWFGVGTDSFGDFFRLYRTPELVSLIGENTTTNDAHNFFLNTLATSGLIAVIPLATLSFMWIFRVYKFTRKSQEQQGVEAAIMLGSIAYFLQSLFTVHHLGISIFGIVLVATVLSRGFTGNWPEEVHLQSRRIAGGFITNRANLVFLSLSLFVLTMYSERFLNDVRAYRVLTEFKDYSQAVDQLGYFKRIMPLSDYWSIDPARSLLLTEELVRLGAKMDAEEAARKVLAKNPNSRDALWTLVAVLDVREKRVEEISIRESLIRREPSSVSLYLDQVQDLLAIGRIELAEAILIRMREYSEYDQSNQIEIAEKLISDKRSIDN